MKELAKEILKFFTTITTGSTLGAAISISLVYPGRGKILSVALLWQILLLSFLVALTCCIFYAKKELTKKQYALRVLIHYVITNLILVGGGKLFGWLDMDENENVLGFVVLVTLIYVIIAGVTFNRDKKISAEMNAAIQRYHRRQEKE